MFVDAFPPDLYASKPLADRPLEQLEHEICELSAQLSAQTCHWLGLVAEFDRREGWASWGVRSCADWLAWKCAISGATTREHVRVSRAIEHLPLIRAAFGRGELSYTKARALTRVATADSEAELVEFASHSTAAQLEQAVRAYKRVKRLEDVQEAHQGRYLSHYWDEDGCLVISARLPAEQGMSVLAALRAAKDALDAGVSAGTPAEDAPAVAADPVGPDAVDVSAETPAGDYVFRRRDGRTIPAAPVPPALTGASIQARNRANGHTITAHTNQHGSGERMHLRDTVDALITWIDGNT